MGISRKCVKTWIDRYNAEGEAGLHDRSRVPATPTGPAPRSSNRSWRCGWPSGAGRTGSDPSSDCRRGRYRGSCAATACPTCASATDDRTADPGIQGHRSPLRTRTPWRTCPRRRQEARPDPRRWRLEDPRPRRGNRRTRQSWSDSTTCTRWSMTTPGWPTRDLPTRREPPARRSCSAPPGLRGPRHPRSEVITDNHLSYKRSHDVRDAIAALGARHLFIKAHCPWQNGKVERFNRTLADRVGLPPALPDQRRTHRRPCPWLEDYNTARRHCALGGLPPISRLPT